MEEKLNVGIIGCGVISDIYLQNLTTIFKNVSVIACADLIVEKAKQAADKYQIAQASGVDDLLNNEAVDIIVNLTIPQAHAEVATQALMKGKHVFEEKPLAISTDQGKTLVALSKQEKLHLCCAPDTFLGAGYQTARKIIDDGWIGEVVGVSAFMGYGGPESWHPNPAFLYKKGAGPLLDIGPYYLTALVALFGPIETVAGLAKMTFPKRTITSQPLYGEQITVEEPTHVNALLKFHSGVQAQLTTSFDVAGTSLPNIEVYGTQGTLILPDPNTYGGPIKILHKKQNTWCDLPLLYGYQTNSRGLAVADLAAAIKGNRKPRTDASLGLHVLETMHGIKNSSESGTIYTVESTCERPQPFDLGMLDGIIA
ncbi:MAG: Gfo/Idh/MocA family protein [Sphaerochaetaceae bacterium]